jgi:hypothetical protein
MEAVPTGQLFGCQLVQRIVIADWPNNVPLLVNRPESEATRTEIETC